MDKQPSSRMCFVSGIENPLGLRLRFYVDDEGLCMTRFQPWPEHLGFPSQLQGGPTSTLVEGPA